ncbi:hypothetical protein [Mucilaginibacter auburnensis]|uniref:Lipoprotein n=1 Tax=Mucilaginibacter auburnensis TaxID=1457233 RepID=A0A2H9VPJ1_9SPHI|nr:hypothetical protein [Mucilaginibacter auburnensis]PJJ80231.1 hypothetical protein CLV57_3378 [Mucilaginibacter auburnensis]
MKRITCLILVAIFTSACKRNLSPTQKLIEKYKPMIQGVWDNKEEMDEIARSKRIPQKDTTRRYVSVLSIETEKIYSDKIPIYVGYNNGEGGDLIFKFQLKPRPALVCGDRYELRYNISSRDTIVYLYTKEKDSVKVTEFVKVLQKLPSLERL